MLEMMVRVIENETLCNFGNKSGDTPDNVGILFAAYVVVGPGACGAHRPNAAAAGDSDQSMARSTTGRLLRG
jgi:hypothetical protein